MNINIFLVCYNEAVLLPHTIAHYKAHLPNANITIYDNQSTDNSSGIAKSLGCTVIEWNTNNITDEHKLRELKNNCWKNIKNGWIIMADMDEWLDINENQLYEEQLKGTTMIDIKGVDMIGVSNKIDLSDINLHQINICCDNDNESKNLCFYRDEIKEMNYKIGAHQCEPDGFIQLSSNQYINKHMCNLGLPFLQNKMINRYNRSLQMINEGINLHYTNDATTIINNYNDLFNNSYFLY